MNLQPLGDRVVVQSIEAEQTTASGIVLPDTAAEKPQRGKVLAVGAAASRTASVYRCSSRRVTRSSTPSTAAPRSSSTARTF